MKRRKRQSRRYYHFTTKRGLALIFEAGEIWPSAHLQGAFSTIRYAAGEPRRPPMPDVVCLTSAAKPKEPGADWPDYPVRITVEVEDVEHLYEFNQAYLPESMAQEVNEVIANCGADMKHHGYVLARPIPRAEWTAVACDGSEAHPDQIRIRVKS